MDSYEHDGLRFDVRDRGPADGDTVVLLHGFPQDGTSWDLVVPALHAQGLRTLVPDLRGYSPGARPDARGEYTASRLAGDVTALLDAAGVDRAHIVGHDWGGAAAWFVAGLHPDRVKTVTVVSTPHPGAMQRSWVTSSQLLRSWYMIFFQLPWVPESLLGALGERRVARRLAQTGLPRERAAHYARRMAEPGAWRGGLNWYRGLPLSVRTPVPRPRMPATYVWGCRDVFLGRAAAELTARFVAGPYRFLEIEDGGHWLPETHSAPVAEAILDRVQSSDQ